MTGSIVRMDDFNPYLANPNTNIFGPGLPDCLYAGSEGETLLCVPEPKDLPAPEEHPKGNQPE